MRTWLVSILVRQAALVRRNRRPGERLDGQTAGRSGVAGADARMDVATMLAGLSAEHREVIVLRELHGMTYDEMASALGVPRGTVESRLHRARAELREKFGGYG